MLEFFIPSNRKTERGNPTGLDGMNELVAAERINKRVGNAMKKRNGKHAEKHCKRAMDRCGWECPKRKCKVTLTFVEASRARDPDNIYSGAKFILDGITKPRGKKRFGAGAIEDDSQRWIDLRYGEEILVDREHPGCWVRIEEET